jgi:phosphonate transport system substrate-binding protein
MYLTRAWLLSALAAAAAVSTPAPTPVLRVTAIPEAKDEFQKNEALFTAWLKRQAGVAVTVRVAESYDEAVKLLVDREADLGWLGGVTTVQAMARSGGRIRPIVIREKDREFKSYVIAASSLEAGSLQALRGKRFTFGAPLSTSGHVMPRFFLSQQGLVPEKVFASVAYSGDHKKTVREVASGEQDCGAVNYKVFDQMVADKAVDPAKVKVVWTSPTFVDQSWVAARDLDVRLGPGALQRITAAFLGLDASRPEDRRVLDILKTERYVEARPEWWRTVAAAVEVIKLGSSN